MSATPGPRKRRRSHVEMPVAYAAVGASKAPDLLRFPPEGSTPYEEELRLGSGQDRFLVSSSLLMTWGAQRGAGVRVTDVDRGDDDAYVGVAFDDRGQPESAPEREEHFGPDGEPYLVAGTTAVLAAEGEDPRSVLVIYTVEEERRVGFAWGTRDERGAVGEQLFTVEHRDDDTVWAVARGFLIAPRSGLLGLKARADVRGAIEAVKRQLEALAPGGGADPRDRGTEAGESAGSTAEPTATEPATPEPVPAEPVPAEPGAAAPVDPVAPAEPGSTEPGPAPEVPASDPDGSDPAPEIPASDPDGSRARQSHQRRPSKPDA